MMIMIFLDATASPAPTFVYMTATNRIYPLQTKYNPQETEYNHGELKYNQQEQDITAKNMDIS